MQRVAVSLMKTNMSRMIKITKSKRLKTQFKMLSKLKREVVS